MPGHSGIFGNEKADELARKGSETPFEDSKPAVGLAYSTQRSVIREHYTMKQIKIWQNLDSSRHSRTMVNGPKARNTKYLLNMTREDLRTSIGAISIE